MEWRKVSENEPANNQDVLIYTDRYPHHHIAHRNKEHWDNKDGFVRDRFFSDDGGMFDAEYVIAWMPLPEAPKELIPDWQAIWDERAKKKMNQ